MGCAAQTRIITQDDLTFDIEDFNGENEQAILEIHSHLVPKALMLRSKLIVEIDQGDDSFYVQGKLPETTNPTNYSNHTALTSKKPCLKLHSNIGSQFRDFTEKNVHFDNKIKVVLGDKVLLFRKVKKTKKKSSKINLDEIF